MAKRLRKIPVYQQLQAMQHNTQQVPQHFDLKTISPLTANQTQVFDDYAEGQNLVLHGYAGTGKTFIAMYLALKDVLVDQKHEKIYIIRSAVSTRDIGFLPGNIKEKIKVFEEPYRMICNDLFSRGDGYEILKTKDFVEFTTTSFMRGLTYENCIIVIDEFSNMSFHEINTIMTRIGDNCRVIFCGDFRQTDLRTDEDKQGIQHFLNIIENMDAFALTEFEIEDIVRSNMVKEWIIESTKYMDKLSKL